MSLFYKLTTDTAAELIAAKLPSSSWKLWIWITTLNPFGDRSVQITWKNAKKAIKISKTTFYRALRLLVDSGLLVIERMSCFCVSFKNGTPDPDAETESQNRDSQSQNCDPTLYIDLQTFQTLSDREDEEKIQNTPEPDSKTEQGNEVNPVGQVSQDSPVIAEVIQNAPVEPKSQGKEKYSAARTKKSTKNFNWLPEGPWNLDGKLDPNFVDYIAKDWVKRFGGDIHAKRADVLSHFKKDPANLAIRWEQYRSEFVDRVQNAKILLSKGVSMKPEIQDKLLTNQRAVTAEFPPELNPVAPQSDCLAGVTEVAALMPTPEQATEPSQNAPAPAHAHIPVEVPAEAVTEEPIAAETTQAVNEAEATTPAHAEIPAEATTPAQAEPIAEVTETVIVSPVTPSKNTEAKQTQVSQHSNTQSTEDDRNPAKLRAMVNAFLKGFGGERQTAPKPPTELEKLNSWLQDPLLRDDAIAIANRSESYKYCPWTEEIIYCEEF